MMVKTRELIGDQLDWVVREALTKSEHSRGRDAVISETLRSTQLAPYSRWWMFGGPIIHREGIGVQPSAGLRPVGIAWSAEYSCAQASLKFLQHGPTPLIASMRCFVASKFGDEVDIPEELL